MSNISDEDFSETSSISGSESSTESSESYLTAEDVERYDDSLEPIATEEEIASYAEQLAIKKRRRRCSGADFLVKLMLELSLYYFSLCFF